MKLTPRQLEVLQQIAGQCVCAETGCTGGCDHGWYEPIEGRMLTVARRLYDKGLICLTNGTHRRWIAGHVTKAGRFALNSTSNRRGAGAA